MDSSSSPLSFSSCLLVIALVGHRMCEGGVSIYSMSMGDVDLGVFEGVFRVLKRVMVILQIICAL